MSLLAVDYKAQVPLGIAVRTKQASILNAFGLRGKLSNDTLSIGKDSSWCLLSQHFVQFSLVITYSGTKYIAIRSMKHDTGNTFAHDRDFTKSLHLRDFKEHMLDEDSVFKPILIIATDGGTDGNPRYPNTWVAAVDCFWEPNLYVRILYTKAPGYSTYSHVDRRMAPLSKQPSSLILPHDTCGTYLDHNEKTGGRNLERTNF